MKKLPKNLAQRIVTTSADVYMRHYDLSPDKYDLIGVSVSTHAGGRESSLPDLSDELFNEMKKTMAKNDYEAVTDMRISQIVGIISTAYLRATMYGTAIVPTSEK